MFDIDTVCLTGAGRLDPDPRWSMASHVHSFWEFIYFVRGTGRIDVPSSSIRAQQYHLVVYPPGLPHAEFSDPFDPEETIFLSVEVKADAVPGSHHLLPDITGDIGWLCKHIYQEFAENGSSNLVQTYTKSLLILVDRTWKCSVSVKHDIVDAAIQLINSEYTSDLTLDDISRTSCAGKFSLAHSFKKRLGISPLRYLQQVRIEAAKRLLITTDNSVNSIAVNTGFADPLYFSRLFKENTGVSPSEFRRLHNKAM